jgi:phenylacetate-CoA ligase
VDPGVTELITDADRYPTLTDAGAKMLEFLREHPSAPIYRNQSGNRLSRAEVDFLLRREQEVLAAQIDWPEAGEPSWVQPYLANVRPRVPAYRGYGDGELQRQPCISRADLNRDVTQFVPDDLPLDRLINFRTSGTSGHPLLLPSHPVVAGSYLAYHKRALRRFGITLQHGRGQVGVVLLGFQEKCFTYTSVTPTMNESGLAKINLHPNDWRHVDDRARYLDALAPEVYAGDPISFSEFLTLPLKTRPRALISTSMALSAGLRSRLEDRFSCPVLDVYSMNEAGPVAVFDPSLGGHVLLQDRMFVEIVDQEGRRLGPGRRGEITLTGGFNHYLPLIRYRTGDYASLERRGGEWALIDLQGRPPVRFRAATGEWKNNIELTHALQQYPLSQYTVRQRADGAIVFTTIGTEWRTEVVKQIQRVLGANTPVEYRTVNAFEGKVIQYTSDLPQP